MSYSVFARTTVEQILKNNPTLDPFYAHELAFTIDKYADKYKFPANVFAGMIMVESSYKLDAVNKKSNDFGLCQVNIWHVKKKGLSIERLLTDVDYSVKQGAIIFSWFYKTYPTVKEAVSRFNCGTRKECIQWKKVIRYWNLVKKYM
jgi:soluble lytic murein transglycosylase-like protein